MARYPKPNETLDGSFPSHEIFSLLDGKTSQVCVPKQNKQTNKKKEKSKHRS